MSLGVKMRSELRINPDERGDLGARAAWEVSRKPGGSPRLCTSSVACDAHFSLRNRQARLQMGGAGLLAWQGWRSPHESCRGSEHEKRGLREARGGLCRKPQDVRNWEMSEQDVGLRVSRRLASSRCRPLPGLHSAAAV